MSQIKGILFDKDGTLIHFHDFFIQVAKQLVEQLINDFQISDNYLLDEELLRVIGIRGNKVDSKGIIASGTSLDISEAFWELLQEKNVAPCEFEDLHNWVSQKLFILTKSNTDLIKPLANLQELLAQLKRHGMMIGIATADDWESTIFCLEKLGIKHYFDFIGTSDHYEKKPNPGMLHAFCEKCKLKSTEVVVVGDTIVDLQLARNGSTALGIGVLSGAGEPKELEALADYLLPSVGEIVQEDGRLIWQSK